MCACKCSWGHLDATQPVSYWATAAAVQAAKSQAIEDLLQQLEGQAPTNVTAALDQLDGDWQLLYTSLTIKVRHD